MWLNKRQAKESAVMGSAVTIIAGAIIYGMGGNKKDILKYALLAGASVTLLTYMIGHNGHNPINIMEDDDHNPKPHYDKI